MIKELQAIILEYKDHKTIFNNRDGFYKSRAWTRTRVYILERDNKECKACASVGSVSVGKRLIVHHIQPLEYAPELALDASNLVTLCINCHNEVHKVTFNSNKKHWDDEWY